jgi:hypothetical protein
MLEALVLLVLFGVLVFVILLAAFLCRVFDTPGRLRIEWNVGDDPPALEEGDAFVRVAQGQSAVEDTQSPETASEDAYAHVSASVDAVVWVCARLENGELYLRGVFATEAEGMAACGPLDVFLLFPLAVGATLGGAKADYRDFLPQVKVRFDH